MELNRQSWKIKVVFGRLVIADVKARTVYDRDELLNSANGRHFGGKYNFGVC